MGYYMAGDYYAAGGLWGTITGAVGGAVKGFVKGGPLGAIGGAISGATNKPVPTKVMNLPVGPMPTIVPTGGGTIQKKPGFQGLAERLVPGGATGYEYVGQRRRRMNVANPKALRRAIRREAGFVKLARRALRGTAYTIVSKGSRSRRPLNIRESGAGSVVVR